MELFANDDVPSIIARIYELIEQPQLRRQFSKATGLDMGKFDSGNVIDRWTDLFKMIEECINK